MCRSSIIQMVDIYRQINATAYSDTYCRDSSCLTAE